MACTFTIGYQGTAAGFVALLKSKLESQGGTFSGDDSAGNFDVSLLGSHIGGGYAIHGQQMRVDITQKPFFISCDQIQKYIQNNLTQVL